MAAYFSTDNLNRFLSPTFHSAIHINARSIRKHFDDIQLLLSALDNPFSLIGISETWLNDDDKNLFDLPSYKSEYSHRANNNHGGVAVYIKSNVHYNRRYDIELDVIDCESVWVQLNYDFLKLDNKSFIFGCIYRSPSSSVKNFCEALQNVMHTLALNHANVVIMGDFNINLLDLSSPSSLNYSGVYQSFGYECLISIPTRCINNGSTLIDHALSNLSVAPDAGVLKVDISDHYPIFVRFNCHATPTSIFFIRQLLDRESFIHDVMSTDWSSLICLDDPQMAYTEFSSILLSYIQRHTQVYKCKKVYASPQNPWITEKLLKQLRAKENLYRKTKRKPFNTNLIARYKRLCNTLTLQLKNAKKQYYERKVNEAGSNIKKKWEIVNSFLNRKGCLSSITTINYKNVKYDSPLEIAEAFSDYFFNTDVIPDADYQLPLSRLPQSFFLFPTTCQEVHDVIRNLNTTSAGPDGISPTNVKIIAHAVSDILSSIINLAFKTGIFPVELKSGKVVPVLKKGDRTQIFNYRPICIIPFFSKVFEKLLENRLSKYLHKFQVLSLSQFGFRQDYSTELALLSLTEKLKRAIDKGLYAGSVFIDFTKAFDTINHYILFLKLEAIGVTGPALMLIKNYLLNRSQVVSLSGFQSTPKVTNIGVPQGSILGPLLFIIYINDLPTSLTTSESLLYADDTTIINTDKCLRSLTQKLNNDLSSLTAWCFHNKLQINPTKTKFVVFHSHQREHNHIPPIFINQFAIEADEEATFLGIQLDRNLKFLSHIALLRRKMAYGIRVLLKARDIFSQPTLLSLYYAFIHSHLNYCITSWGNTYSSHLVFLQTMQNQSIRILTHSHHRCNAIALLQANNILTVCDTFKYKLGILLYKQINNLLPVSIIPPSNLVNTNLTRFAHNRNLILPRVQNNYGKQTIYFNGIHFWNTIPPAIKTSQSIGKFKKELKTFLSSHS